MDTRSHGLRAGAAIFLALALTGLGGPSAEPTGVGAAAAAPSLAPLRGQKLVAGRDGPVPGADLLGGTRRGEVGGVILLGPNTTTGAALVALPRQLHAAALAGGQPPLLVAVD